VAASSIVKLIKRLPARRRANPTEKFG